MIVSDHVGKCSTCGDWMFLTYDFWAGRETGRLSTCSCEVPRFGRLRPCPDCPMKHVEYREPRKPGEPDAS